VLAELRERACLAGADDALLCTGDGSVLETAHSSLVWWRDERLYLPAAELPTLPSVTRALVVGLAERRGVTVAFEHIQAHEVSALDAWTLNALHGIRPVSGWLGSTGSRHARSSVGSRPEEWSVALDELMVPVDDIPFE
jgi:branched-subunit amino acid aminotransferase/4-amino-4-deoxychorismate lyase